MQKRFAIAERLNRNQFVCTESAAYVILDPDSPNRLNGLVMLDANSNAETSQPKRSNVPAQLHRLFDLYWDSPHAMLVNTILRRRIISVGHPAE